MLTYNTIFMIIEVQKYPAKCRNIQSIQRVVQTHPDPSRASYVHSHSHTHIPPTPVELIVHPWSVPSNSSSTLALHISFFHIKKTWSSND